MSPWNAYSVFLIAFVMLLFGSFTLGRGETPDEMWFAEGSGVFIACLALVPLLFEAILKRLDPLNPRNLFLLLFALQFGFYPIYVITGGARAPAMRLAVGAGIEQHYAYAQILAVLGLSFYLLGYSSRVAERAVRFLPRPQPLDPHRVKFLIWPLFIIGYVAVTIFLFMQGGVRQFLLSRELWRSQGLIGEGPFMISVGLGLPMAALLPMILRTKHNEPWRRTISRFAFLCVCLLPAFVLGFRSLIIGPILQGIVIVNYRRKEVPLKILVWIGIFLGVFMTLYGLSRETISDVSQTVEDAKPEDSLGLVIFRTPGTDLVATILSKDPAQHFDYGITGVIESATIVIPRAIWPGKPLSWGQRFSTTFFGDYLYMNGIIQETYGGVNPSAIGYFYTQFGMMSVVMGMFLLGVATKAFYLYGTGFVGPNTAFLLFILLWTVPVEVADAPQNVLNQIVITVCCAWIPMSYFARQRKRVKPAAMGQYHSAV